MKRISVFSLAGAVGLASCQGAATDSRKVEGDLRKTVQAQAVEIRRLRGEVAIAQADATALRQVYTSSGSVRGTDRDGPASEPEQATPARRAVAMCFKDYCPCDPPQGGPDSVLCDQLEQGIEPDTELMIGGRGMREARRQMATGDY